MLRCCRLEYCTASADGSVRIWDITSHQQLYEFGGSSSSSRACGAPTSAAYHPAAYQLAIGYSSGLLRLFDVATTTLLLVSKIHNSQYQQQMHVPEQLLQKHPLPFAAVQLYGWAGRRQHMAAYRSCAHNSKPCFSALAYCLQEQQQHKGPVTQLLFTPDGSRMLSCGADGKLVACDTSRHCTAVKVLLPTNMTSSNTTSSSSSAGQAQRPVCAAVSPDGQLVAVGGSAAGPVSGAGGATISVFAAGSLEAVLCMETTAQGFVRWVGGVEMLG
jgi:WD40 repeat protein